MRSNVQIQELHLEIARQLEELPESEPELGKRLKWFEQQHKKPGLSAHGIRTPVVRKLIRSFMSEFRRLGLEDKLALAIRLYQSGNFEQATVADTLVELAIPGLTPKRFELFDEVVGTFNNWASVDWLCLHGLQSLLLAYRQETLDLLRAWNCSENLWKRRASVLAFVRKIGSSGEFTDEALELCDNLIWDEEDIVQKGVGLV